MDIQVIYDYVYCVLQITALMSIQKEPPPTHIHHILLSSTVINNLLGERK